MNYSYCLRPAAVGGDTGLFDETMGHLQSILLGELCGQQCLYAVVAGYHMTLLMSCASHVVSISEESFSELREAFLEKHCQLFEDSEENKLIYTDIFKQYVGRCACYVSTVMRCAT